MTEYPAFEFETEEWYRDQMFADGCNAWAVKTLWEAAQDLPVYEVPIVGFNTDIQPWDSVGDDFMEFCKHALLVQKANTKYPLILTPSGVIADGRHRLAKALITGQSTIKIKRLVKMPPPDYDFDENGDIERSEEDE